MKYRSEVPFGDGVRKAANIMAHECFELGNTDIFDTLSATILKDTPFVEKFEILKEEFETDEVSDKDTNGELYNLIETHDSYDDDNVPSILFFQTILDEIKRITGKDIKYALWLCDTPEDVKNYDLHDEVNNDNIDVYIESDIVLSDIGVDGKLYGYEENPESCCTVTGIPDYLESI